MGLADRDYMRSSERACLYNYSDERRRATLAGLTAQMEARPIRRSRPTDRSGPARGNVFARIGRGLLRAATLGLF